MLFHNILGILSNIILLKNIFQLDSENKDVDQNSKALNPCECRAELRERFLWAMTSLVGQQATVSMQDNITVKGVFRGMDKDILRIHMQDLHTPAAVQPWAMLRLPDCFSLTFKM